MKRSIITLTVIILVASGLILYPSETAQSARNALVLCGNVLIPSLFPFFVLSSYAIDCGIGALLGRKLGLAMHPLFNVNGIGSSVLILGLLGGYPVGAACAVDLYRKKLCSRADTMRLLAFCNNCGPAFIFGAIGGGIFGSVRIGCLLYIIHIVSALCVGLIFRSYGEDTPHKHIHNLSSNNNTAISAFPTAIKSAASSTINVCAFVVFFAVILKILEILNITSPLSPIPRCILTGFLELTNGIYALPLSNGNLSVHIVIVSALLGFGGLSVHSQVLSFLCDTDLKAKTYFAGKLLHAIIAALLAFLLLNAPFIVPIILVIFIISAFFVKKDWKKHQE